MYFIKRDIMGCKSIDIYIRSWFFIKEMVSMAHMSKLSGHSQGNVIKHCDIRAVTA